MTDSDFGVAGRVVGRAFMLSSLNARTLHAGADVLDTLCTIPDVRGALLEVRRALAPSGRFYFVEDGLAEEARVERWQHRLNSTNQRLLGGCNLTRPIATVIEQAGFEIERLEKSYMKDAPTFAGFLYRGVARRIRQNEIR